jgi:hypothetical protein
VKVGVDQSGQERQTFCVNNFGALRDLYGCSVADRSNAIIANNDYRIRDWLSTASIDQGGANDGNQ